MIDIKTIRNCFESMTNVINIEFAIKDAFRNKHRNKKSNKLYYKRFKSASMIRKLVRSGEYPKQYKRTTNTIIETAAKKKRDVTKPEEIEHVIHHMVCLELEPYFKKSFYPFCVASVPGRGDEYGLKYMKRWVNDFVDSGKKFYVLKFDIKKFFDSIDRYVLFNKIKRVIKDERMINVIHKIIWYDNDYTAKGIPIGFYTSQWFANFYLQDFDYYIMHTLKNKYKCKELKMMRYADDVVILGYNKKKLHKIFNDIEEYCHNELHLEIKYNWQVYAFEHVSKKKETYGNVVGRTIDYMGFVFHKDRTTMRKNTLCRARRRVYNIRRKINNNKRLNWYLCSQALSGICRMLRVKTFNYYIKYISPIITKDECINCIKWSVRLKNYLFGAVNYIDNINTNLVDSFKILYHKIRGEDKDENRTKISLLRKWIKTNINRLSIKPYSCVS